MANQEWLTGSDLGEFNEGTIFVQNPEGRTDVEKVEINYQPSDNIIDGVRYMTLTPILISSNLPDTVTVNISSTDNTIFLIGKFPIVTEDKEYGFTLRLKEVNKNNINDIRAINDRYFTIKNKNIPQEWKKNRIEVTCYNGCYFTSSLTDDITNLNGDEVFKRISGVLPNGVTIDNDGTVSGYPDVDISQETTVKTDYNFYIQILSNNEIIPSLNTDIIPGSSEEEPEYGKLITIKLLADYNQITPQWITEKSIGNVNINETPNLQILAIINDSTNNITYEYNEEDKVKFSRIGLTLTPSGKITGICKTKQIKSWSFRARAVYTSPTIYNKTFSSEKEFIVSTNMVSSEHSIEWIDNGYDLGEYIIGNNISLNIPKAHSLDDDKITYSFVGSDYPKGLKISSDGNIYGNINYQTDGTYTFEIMASNSHVYISRNFVMKLKKGLGNNAIKLYLKINNEYKDEYNDIKNQLNSKRRFKINDSNYKVDAFPKIDVATLKCFDREVLAAMLNFGNPEIVRFGLSKMVSVVSTDTYDVIYKSINENTYQWDEIKCGDFNFEEELETRKNLDITDPSKLENTAEIDFNNEIYKTDIKQLIWDSDYEMMVEKEFNTTPSDSYNVFNFKLVRNVLSTPIYVKQLDGTYYYDLGSQEIYGEIDDIELEGDNIGIIENPWCYDKTKNHFILDKIPDDADMALPNVTTNDVEYSSEGYPYILFLDKDVEPLPAWKRKQPLTWKANTTYKLNDIILYNFTYYRVIQQFTTGNIFNYDENVLEKISDENVKEFLPKEYFPSLDLGYYDYGSVKNDFSELNKKELEGNFWYRKDFLFWELIAEPLYNNDIESFGIPFYSNENRLKDKISNVRDVTLTMEVMPLDANVTIIYDNINYTDGEQHEGYTRVGNVYTLKVKPGKRLIWSVEKEGYFTQSGNYILVTDEYINVNLLKKCLIIVNPVDIYGNTLDANITLDPENENDVYERIYENKIYKAIDVTESKGYIENGRYYFCYSNPDETYDGGIIYNRLYKFENNNPIEQYYKLNNINYSYSCVYDNSDTSNPAYYIVLPGFCELKINPTPSDSTIAFNAEGYEQKNNLIGVLKGTTVGYAVYKFGYREEIGEIQSLNENTVLDVELVPGGYPIDVSDYEYRMNNNDGILIKYIGTNDVVTLPNI